MRCWGIIIYGLLIVQRLEPLDQWFSTWGESPPRGNLDILGGNLKFEKSQTLKAFRALALSYMYMYMTINLHLSSFI